MSGGHEGRPADDPGVLVHFSECVVDGKDPRTPGEEGVADVRVIAAIAETTQTGEAVAVRR